MLGAEDLYMGLRKLASRGLKKTNYRPLCRDLEFNWLLVVAYAEILRLQS